ncbi:hypothetical protein L1049_011378 [Liquidambar formosana]|uniref:Uncharacterized protein n=1 Tax=Liquidambar formosana TaxID=63359 RepID=A0AAP0WY29_LIQFO
MWIGILSSSTSYPSDPVQDYLCWRPSNNGQITFSIKLATRLEIIEEVANQIFYSSATRILKSHDNDTGISDMIVVSPAITMVDAGRGQSQATDLLPIDPNNTAVMSVPANLPSLVGPVNLHNAFRSLSVIGSLDGMNSILEFTTHPPHYLTRYYLRSSILCRYNHLSYKILTENRGVVVLEQDRHPWWKVPTYNP